MPLPAALRLEASSHCQLRCPSCPTTTGAIQAAVGSGFLRLSDFEALLDANPQLKQIELSNYGEIFLNPAIVDIIRVGFERGVRLSADNGVNLNQMTEAALEAVVKYKVRSLSCSIDGASNETYEVYRVRGHFDKVIANIRSINALKRAYGSPYPRLIWQFVVFGHNEHELPTARALAAELDMSFKPKLTWDPDFAPIRDADAVRRELGAASREEYLAAHGTDYMAGLCEALWDQPQVNWDGKLLGCGRNFWGDFGPENVFKDGLARALDSEKMGYAKKMLMGLNPAREGIPCSTCDIYLERKKKQAWVRRPSTARRLLRLLWHRTGLGHLRKRFARRP